MRNLIHSTEEVVVKRTIGEALLFTAAMLAAVDIFAFEGEDLCPVVGLTIVAAVTFGFTELIIALKEAVDK